MLRIFSSGSAWERAFTEAAKFLDEPDGVLLLGPGIGDSAKAWLEDRYLRSLPVRFGARIQPWDEWVKGRARAFALSQGKGFRPLNAAAKREHFRIVAKALADNGAFHHLQSIWEEERFFSALLECVDEARCAGLYEETAIERAKDMLAGGAGAVTREAYEDFWNLLSLYERLLSEDPRLDEASLLRLATESADPVPSLFLLGFDGLSLLEANLVQELAKVGDVHLPLALEPETLAALVAGRETALDHPAALSLRGLLTNFSGKVRLEESAAAAAPPRRYFLSAHAPALEARAAAALGRAAEAQEIRFLAPSGFFDDESVVRAFQEELGLPANFLARRALSHPVAQLFFHALAVKEEDYSLAYGLELAQLLEFSRGEFGDIDSRAARAGVRKGLADWKRKAGEDRELQEFAVLLENIDRILPASGSAGAFAVAAELLAERLGIGELARRAPDLEKERDAHAALSGVLRNAQMLAASTRSELTFSEWIRELSALLKGSLVGEVFSLYPKVQFYRYGEWLPPAGEKSLTLALGLDAGVEPRREFQFYLEESARRKLSELLLPTQVQADLAFRDTLKRVAHGGAVIFSRSSHDGRGKEQEPSWALESLELSPEKWPEVAPVREAPSFRVKEEVKTAPGQVKKFSASLFELYKECPFKAFAGKILRLEDQVQESSLDVNRLDEGSLAHKALELFYGKRGGRGIMDGEESARALKECVAEAAEDQRIEYFKGNEDLFRSQLERLEATLLEFVAADAANYAQFPLLGEPELERKVSGFIGKFPWEGKIDRIDLDPENKKLLVVDYKIGTSVPDCAEIAGLRRFQLQLYMDAAEEAHSGFEAVGGYYLSLATHERKQGMVRAAYNAAAKETPGPKYFQYNRGGILKTDEEFAELRESALAEMLRLAERIDAGEFPVRPLEESSCARCSVRPACRIRELRSPLREDWARVDPSALLAFLGAAPAPAKKESPVKGFNKEQQDALDRRGALVFIEASAGTGKTTVIVERIRRFLEERIQTEAAHLAVERFAAISFTEKSAEELRSRAAKTLLADAGLGPRVAAQAQQQIRTIHGFCRSVLADFPVEAGISPLAAVLDEKSSDSLLATAVEEFFLFPDAGTRAKQELVFREFSRARAEELILKLHKERALYEEEVALFRAGRGGERLFPEGAGREVLLVLIEFQEAFSSIYERMKRERSVLDFNDLEALALKVLRNEKAREYYRKRFELILVDEFQDTNPVQRAICEAVARPEWANLFVVGDAKQSIYRFRAADVSVFQELRKEAEAGGKLVSLSTNYRSKREIVAAANEVTKAMFPAAGESAPDFEAIDAPAVAHHSKGGRMALVEYGAEDKKWTAEERRGQEAGIVAGLVKEIRGRPGKPLSVAVLLRKFSGNEAFLRALMQAGIPFRVGSSKGFYGQSIITDSIALLRTLYGAKNDLALLAVLRSPWAAMDESRLIEIHGRAAARTPLWDKLRPEEIPSLVEWRRHASHSSLAETLARAYARYPMGRREHLQSAKLLSIIRAMEAEGNPRMEILDRLSSWSGWDREDDASDEAMMPEPGGAGTVQVMTVHAAKGLEFDVTILPDLVGKPKNDNSPLRMVRGAGLVLKLEGDGSKYAPYTDIGRRSQERELAELKRLFYVAITRAQQEEYLILPRSQAPVPREKWVCCADFLRAADASGFERMDGDAYSLETHAAKPKSVERSGAAVWSTLPAYPRFRDTSISELAAYQFCGEFHRRKFVQGWDDRILALWPKPPGSFRKFSAPEAPKDPERERVGKLLRALKIERKERGIALHRVLERVKHHERDLDLCSIWLVEAYEAQGVDVDSPRLRELVALDLGVIGKFLVSPLGAELFGAEVRAFPEIPFVWKLDGVRLHGAMDRLIRKPDGTWIVVDYKSSILEESLDRYRFQVASYMAAVEQHARAAEGGSPRVEGYLVDLFEARSYPVTEKADASFQALQDEVEKAASNYTLADPSPEGRGVIGGEHCFHCPYSLHCDLGVKIVLASK